MILLTILFTIGMIAFTIITGLISGFIVVFGDAIICVLAIVFIAKLIKYLRNKRTQTTEIVKREEKAR